MKKEQRIAHETALQIMANIVPAGPQDAANLIIIECNVLTAIQKARSKTRDDEKRKMV